MHILPVPEPDKQITPGNTGAVTMQNDCGKQTP